jgi:RNA polymerase sigma-70 factor (ECF subfamily)
VPAEQVAELPREDAMERGRRARFEQVWEKERPRIWRLVARLAADADVADDLTQEVCVRAFRAFAEFRGEASVFTWLSRIAINVVHRYRERTQREVVSWDTPEITALRADEAKGPEHVAIAAELRRAVWTALERLPEELRTTLILQVYEDLKYREIASILDVPISTVKYRRHEAMLRLRQELEDYAL